MISSCSFDEDPFLRHLVGANEEKVKGSVPPPPPLLTSSATHFVNTLTFLSSVKLQPEESISTLRTLKGSAENYPAEPNSRSIGFCTSQREMGEEEA